MVNRIMSHKYLLPPSVPLMTTRHLFTGESDQCFTTGHYYTVIESGYHWIKEYGFGIWLTCDDYPETTDSDLGVFMSVDDFTKQFFTP